MKYQVFQSQPLTNLIKALPRKYGVQMKPSNEAVSAIYYTKEYFTVTSIYAAKGIEILGETEHKKIAIAHNFTDEAIELFHANRFNLILYSRFPASDEQIMNRAHESE